MSSKREKFIMLAEKRVTRAIKDLRLIGNLANRHNYDYTEDDTQKIISVLEMEFKHMKNKFSVSGGKGPKPFSLSGEIKV